MFVLFLCCSGLAVFFVAGRLFGRGWSGIDAAGTTVEAGAAFGAGLDMLVIDIGNMNAAEIIDRAVIGKSAAVPASPEESDAGIAEADVQPAVKPDMRPPIAAVKGVYTIIPAPPGGRPKHAYRRGLNPGPGNPIIVVAIPGPVPGGPEIAWCRNCWLNINRKRWRSDAYRDPNGNLRLGVQCRD